MSRVFAYGKFARSWNAVDERSNVSGGDLDVQRMLRRLASALPDDQFFLLGRHQGSIAGGRYPSNVYSPWESGDWELPMVPGVSAKQTAREFKERDAVLLEIRKRMKTFLEGRKFDASVMWVGQVANSNSPLPEVGYDWSAPFERFTIPYQMSMNYNHYLLYAHNILGLEPIMLIPDPRNKWKPRDLMRPLTGPILAQFDELDRRVLHDQFGRVGEPWQEGRSWLGGCIVDHPPVVYSGLELSALDHPSEIPCSHDHDRPHEIGLISNGNKTGLPADKDRVVQIKQWMGERLASMPFYGKWTSSDQTAFGRAVEPIPPMHMTKTLQTFRATMTFPASGSGWVTAKPWEAFAAGTVMFIHPEYDVQDHLFKHYARSYRPLRKFLRVYTHRQLRDRLRQLEKPEVFDEITRAQRSLFEEAFETWAGGSKLVLERLNEKD